MIKKAMIQPRRGDKPPMMCKKDKEIPRAQEKHTEVSIPSSTSHVNVIDVLLGHTACLVRAARVHTMSPVSSCRDTYCDVRTAVHLRRRCGAPEPFRTHACVPDDAFSIPYKRKKKASVRRVRIQPSTSKTEGRGVKRKQTHKNAEIAVTTIARPTKPNMKPTLFLDRKVFTAEKPCGSGSTNTSLRPGSAFTLVRFFESKQYCWKHRVQKAERSIGGLARYRARSIAAHCRHLPKSGSGEFVLGRKPPIVFAWT